MATPAYGDPRDWWTPETLREEDEETGEPVWAQAEHLPLSLLADLVEVARDAVVSFAPALPEDYPLGKCPARYRLAHLEQVKNIWNASTVDAGGDMGEGDYVVRPVPLDWAIKQMLRPRTGIPVAL